MEIRELMAKATAGIANANGVQSSRCFSAVWNRRCDRPFRVVNAVSPLWHPAIQHLTYCQNVAGLWLKYGAKSVNIETSSWCAIIDRDVMIC
jgi:hypothetical protein